jgi:hypothetical protein
MATKRYRNIKIIIAATILVALIIFATVAGRSNAQSTPLVQAFTTAAPLQNGTIVQLKNQGSTTVLPLTEANIGQMYGVIVNANSSTFTLSSPSPSTTQSYVAISGTYNVFVSNQNGSIHTGDNISISAISGVGMKATVFEPLILGKALAGFDGSSSTTTTTLKSSTGKSIKVAIGSIPVSITVAKNPLLQNTEANLPGFLQKASQDITSKPVSPTRVYLGVLVIFSATVLCGMLMYAGIRSSLVAVGRNPLSKKSVLKGLFQVTLISLTIFIFGLFGVYLLLTL